jgi:hypothetical protein
MEVEVVVLVVTVVAGFFVSLRERLCTMDGSRDEDDDDGEEW